jgi:hypothetical protein
MALFLIEHNHSAETCPTRNPDMVRALREHVRPENAERFGLKLLADWVNEPEHHLVFVVEGTTQSAAEQFAAPFAGLGSVKVTLGLTCEQVAKDCLGE